MLRLRAEFIEDPEMRLKILTTIDEMQAMTESTLDFIRQDAARDPGRPTNINALAESVAVDFAYIGRPVEFVSGPGVATICRAGAIRRDPSNLIENAVACGECASV